MFSRKVEKHHLLTHIGGPPALQATVEIFYEKIIADESLAKFFEGVNMESLKIHQHRFLTLVLTEIPKDLDMGRILSGTHARLFDMGLNETHFDSVAGHLVASLKNLEVQDKMINEVVAVLAPLRPVFENGAKKTLLARIGGPAALEAAVDIFYEKLVADPSLAKFFEGINVKKLKLHQRGFLTLALTEIPDEVDVSGSMARKHERLFAMGLDENHFDSVAGHLVSTLDELQVMRENIDEIVAIISPLRAVFEEGAKQHKAVVEEDTEQQTDDA
jgi:hemoglobin